MTERLPAWVTGSLVEKGLHGKAGVRERSLAWGQGSGSCQCAAWLVAETVALPTPPHTHTLYRTAVETEQRGCVTF